MAVQAEYWKAAVIGKLFEENPHLNRCKNADEYVVGGVAVHSPQSGGPSGVQRNPAYPLQIVTRADQEIIYILEKYATKAITVADMELAELSYAKTDSIITENMSELIDFIGKDLLVKWAVNVTSAERILTTGAAFPATLPGSTGTRKIITEADIRKAAVMMDNMLMPSTGRVLMLTPDMIDHLRGDDKLKYAFQQTIDIKTGVVGSLYGFDILKKPTVINVDNAFAPKVPEALIAGTDNSCGIFYQQDQVERALGSFNLYQNERRAEYQGDIVSMNVRMGGRNCRLDNKGVGLIVAA